MLLLVFLSACAPRPSLQAGSPVAVEIGDALLADWRERSAGMTALQGLAKVKLQTSEGSMNGTQVVVAVHPDQLRAETLNPFGTPLLLLAADGAQLAVYVPSRGTFYTGEATSANLGRFLRIPLGLEDLVDVLLYRAPLPDVGIQQAMTLDSGGWLLLQSAANRHQELRFDARRRLVEIRYYKFGELFLEIGYGRFADNDDLPREVAVTLPELDTMASLVFEEITFNGTPRPALFQLVPPAGADVVSLDDL